MLTQIICPNCRTPFNTELFQIIDVGQQPELKRMLLSGRLNLALCPNCGFGAQMGTPLVYHDPAHQLLMTYVPMELNLPMAEQQKLIGDFVRQIMDKTPPEKRRGYMLQPQTILTYQTLIEKVLETEGITPEMLARQRQQAELLQTLITTNDSEVVDILLKERASEIDETFFAMLSNILQTSTETDNMEQTIRLTNLQAQLYSETSVGRRIEQQQLVLRKFQKEAQKQGGLSPELLFKHVLLYESDPQLVQALATVGQAALNYTFFGLLSSEIDQRKRNGERRRASDLEDIRKQLLKLYDQAQAEAREVMNVASQQLEYLLKAPDMQAAIREKLPELDEAFMYLLSSTLAQATQSGAKEQAEKLQTVRDLIMEEVESQTPPEIHFLNALLEMERESDRRQLLEANPQMLSPELLNILQMLITQADQAGDKDGVRHIKKVHKQVEKMLASSTPS